MQQTVFAKVHGETLLLLTRRGKHCDYLKLRTTGKLGQDWTDIIGFHLEENKCAVLALKQGKTISV